MHRSHIITAAILLALIGCDRTEPMPSTGAPAYPSFDEDVAFLRQHGEVHVLSSSDGGRVALSAGYQGRVMTSAVAGDAPSTGWIHRAFIDSGETGTQFDNYGGSDRFWLGPEGGQYTLYFPPGSTFEMDTWQVPHAMQIGTWSVVDASDSSVTFRQEMEVSNYSEAVFRLRVERTVRLLGETHVTAHFGNRIPPGLRWVAFESVNQVTNAGDEPWTEERGLISIWIAGMLNTFGTSWVIVPLDGPPYAGAVNDGYFGAVPEGRLATREGYALFKADGEYRSKIGVPPEHAKPIAGSYSPEVGVLTLVHFDLGGDRYVNSMWELQDDPFAGDVFNSYNDGPPGIGGFYELESSSPALALGPGESYTHRHRTMHLSGDVPQLDELSRAVLGVAVSEIEE